MVKKKESSPLFSEDEMNGLLKDAEKREAPIRKKPIEKIATPKTIAKLPKPVKKEVKKEQEKIVKQIKENEPKKEVKQSIPEKTPDIEYVLKTVTKYDVNWYYLKEKLVKFEKWLLTPYTLYANWFNRSFNPPKPKPITIEDLYEDLPEMERKIHLEVNKIIRENIQKEMLK
jgi:hypothetical protein